MNQPTDTDAAIAKAHGVHRSTVGRWRKAGAPLDNPAALADWLAARHHCADAVAPEGIAQHRAEKLRWEAQRAKLTFQRESREVVPIADVKRDLAIIAAAVQGKLGTLVAEAPSWAGLQPHELADKAKEFVRGCFQTFSDSASSHYAS